MIAGSGRSGTTWVLDVIAEANGLRTLFEPLHPLGVPRARPFTNRYARADDDAPELTRFMNPVMSGELAGLWPNYRVQARRLRDPRKLRRFVGDWLTLSRQFRRAREKRGRPAIVKFIRANLMLDWLVRRYGVRAILVLRHPGAVIASKMKLLGPEWRYERHLRAYLSDERLLEDFLGAFAERLSGPLTDVAGHTALWCIENAIPLAQARANGVVPVSYEKLLLRDESEWSAALRALGLSQRADDALLTRPSQQASREMRRRDFSALPVDRWVEAFSKEQLAQMDAMLDLFGVTMYRSSGPLPLEGG